MNPVICRNSLPSKELLSYTLYRSDVWRIRAYWVLFVLTENNVLFSCVTRASTTHTPSMNVCCRRSGTRHGIRAATLDCCSSILFMILLPFTNSYACAVSHHYVFLQIYTYRRILNRSRRMPVVMVLLLHLKICLICYLVYLPPPSTRFSQTLISCH